MAQAKIINMGKKRQRNDDLIFYSSHEVSDQMEELAGRMAQLTCQTMDEKFRQAMEMICLQSQQLVRLTNEIGELRKTVEDMKNKGRFMIYSPPGSPSGPDDSGLIASYIS